jgi:hypothetical protein
MATLEIWWRATNRTASKVSPSWCPGVRAIRLQGRAGRPLVAIADGEVHVARLAGGMDPSLAQLVTDYLVLNPQRAEGGPPQATRRVTVTRNLRKREVRLREAVRPDQLR